MKEPSGESPLLRLERWVQQHRAPMMVIMFVVTLWGVVMGQTLMLVLGSMGLWFVLYPGLSGSARRKLPPRNAAAEVKTAGSINAPTKADTIKPAGIYHDQMLHVLQMKHQIEAAAGQIRDSRLRQSAVATAGGLQELVDAIYELALLSQDTWERLAGAGSEEAAEIGQSVTARVRRWDAQIDHAVSMFDTLLYQTLSLGADGTGSQTQNLEAWPEMLRSETELLRTASARDTGRMLT
jgi:hypothetical protein